MLLAGRMWSGFSSEIETYRTPPARLPPHFVACGAASRLRLKRGTLMTREGALLCRMWSGFSSEIETRPTCFHPGQSSRRMWSGFSSEIETTEGRPGREQIIQSHVERLLV